MPDERTHHVTLNLARDYEFVADFNDIPDAPSILFDEPEPLGGNRAPNAAAVLFEDFCIVTGAVALDDQC